MQSKLDWNSKSDGLPDELYLLPRSGIILGTVHGSGEKRTRERCAYKSDLRTAPSGGAWRDYCYIVVVVLPVTQRSSIEFVFVVFGTFSLRTTVTTGRRIATTIVSQCVQTYIAYAYVRAQEFG
uniref:Uncharacterized protein n=1 Tax=Sipha flava TaxID=143950 RepID=A0A2S2R4H8_9HEMI